MFAAMVSPNDSIPVYTGKFQLVLKNKIVIVNGSLTFEWFPSSETRFSGEVIEQSWSIMDIFYDLIDESFGTVYDMLVDGLSVGKASFNLINGTEPIYLEGRMVGINVIGDKAIPVQKVSFVIANLKEFHGEANQINSDSSNNILLLEDENFSIILRKHPQCSDRSRALTKKGGYFTLYNGEISSRRASITFKDVNKPLSALSMFLNFLNGRRCSPVFRQGIFDNETVWCDYTSYNIDQFKKVKSWTPDVLYDLNKLWIDFNALWQVKEHRQFLNDVLHWYTEANIQSGLIDGAIIMAQTGLELIYNWLIVEQKKLIMGNDADNISASNKIRLLISLLNVSNALPTTLVNLKQYMDESDSNIADAPEAFVQVRNAIVHSQAAKRSKVAEMSSLLKFEVLQLGLWYIELSLLYILKYKGKYINRCYIYENDFGNDVPWA
ncbi:hypothetical protein GCM10028818_33270 [Spirosoma horti]